MKHSSSATVQQQVSIESFKRLIKYFKVVIRYMLLCLYELIRILSFVYVSPVKQQVNAVQELQGKYYHEHGGF